MSWEVRASRSAYSLRKTINSLFGSSSWSSQFLPLYKSSRVFSVGPSGLVRSDRIGLACSVAGYLWQCLDAVRLAEEPLMSFLCGVGQKVQENRRKYVDRVPTCANGMQHVFSTHTHTHTQAIPSCTLDPMLMLSCLTV